jgi:hypothetical protein
MPNNTADEDDISISQRNALLSAAVKFCRMATSWSLWFRSPTLVAAGKTGLPSIAIPAISPAVDMQAVSRPDTSIRPPREPSITAHGSVVFTRGVLTLMTAVPITVSAPPK